jgi:hypothetical protein
MDQAALLLSFFFLALPRRSLSSTVPATAFGHVIKFKYCLLSGHWLGSPYLFVNHGLCAEFPPSFTPSFADCLPMP